MCYLYEPRSKYWYDDDEEGGGESSFSWKEILLFPLFVCLALILFPLMHILMLLALIWIELLEPVVSKFKAKIAPWISRFKGMRILPVRSGRAALIAAGVMILAVTIFLISREPPGPELMPAPPEPTAIAEAAMSPAPALGLSTVEILVDDFSPQPYQGDTVYFYNRLEGDRGAINDSLLAWGEGSVRITLAPGTTWGGVWMSLNHPIREGLAVDFSAILPPQIAAAHQSRITRVAVQILDGTPGRTLKLELKDGDELRWKEAVTLGGGGQEAPFDLPALGEINHLVFVLDQATPGDTVAIDQVTFTATNPLEDTATAAFVWSYGMLLNNWNAESGFVRDKAKDASGEFEAVQATGSLAAATALAWQLGVVEREEAVAIVTKIGEALLNDLPRYHGLWPHWVQLGPDGEYVILENTEWSSVDTVIAAIGLLEAQSALGLDTTGVEELLWSIEWSDLVTPSGISHGYAYSGERIPYAWDVFGGESWLVDLAYAAVTGQVAPLAYSTPPTANGSGFIDELAWLFVPPPQGLDAWGTDWAAYRDEAAERQVTYYPMNDPGACFTQSGYFGLSAGEVPVPAMVDKASIYQAFGVGGRFTAPNDGRSLLGAAVVAPHYSAMVAALRPEQSLRMWQDLMSRGLFTPLNNVESLMVRQGSGCEPGDLEINQLKGSWNLALQTLGWGNYLANQRREAPVLWQAAVENSLLGKGYQRLTSSPALSPTPGGSESSPMAITFERECENPDESTVGQMIWRANASGAQVHGQFGTTPGSPWPAQPGSVTYTNIELSQSGPVTLTLRYSKYSPSSVPIQVYLDDEPTPRTSFIPVDQGDWNNFTWSEAIPLGDIDSGVHTLRFATDGQQYGVADLDKFVLEVGRSIP